MTTGDSKPISAEAQARMFNEVLDGMREDPTAEYIFQTSGDTAIVAIGNFDDDTDPTRRTSFTIGNYFIRSKRTIQE
jgi:hypothetical protein